MIVAANWKMNFNMNEVIDFMDCFLKKYREKIFSSEVLFFPSNLFLERVIGITDCDKNIYIGGQNVHFKNSGSHTGEVSAKMLSSLGCEYVLIGHSECRELDNSNIAERVAISLENSLNVIFCCGENFSIKEEKKTLDFIKYQLDDGLVLVSKEKIKNLIVAYEPIWAIGSGKIPTNDEISTVISFIKEYIYDKYGAMPSVLYGGSCDENNIGHLAEIKGLDGFLIGRASLYPEKLLKILEIVERK